MLATGHLFKAGHLFPTSHLLPAGHVFPAGHFFLSRMILLWVNLPPTAANPWLLPSIRARRFVKMREADRLHVINFS